MLPVGLILAPCISACRSCPNPNTIRYVTVVGEVHRVATFKAGDTMVRGGRSNGLAVAFAAQQPVDLLGVAATKCPNQDLVQAFRRDCGVSCGPEVGPSEPGLSEHARTPGVGRLSSAFPTTSPHPLAKIRACRDTGQLGLSAEGDG